VSAGREFASLGREHCATAYIEINDNLSKQSAKNFYGSKMKLEIAWGNVNDT